MDSISYTGRLLHELINLLLGNSALTWILILKHSCPVGGPVFRMTMMSDEISFDQKFHSTLNQPVPEVHMSIL
jgi:hypothetical protein